MQTRFRTVDVRKLTKVYGGTRALAGVSLALRAGQVTTLLGGNGAGKSTLLNIVATLARPTSGTVRYDELVLPDDRDLIRPAIGLVGHEALVYPDLTPRENLELMARLYDLSPVAQVAAEALERIGLAGMADRAARTLSRGQLQRLALARALLHDPSLLLFDEPTTGLDVPATAQVERAIVEARVKGRIVLVVTHDHALAARIADQRIVLERGRIVEQPAT